MQPRDGWTLALLATGPGRAVLLSRAMARVRRQRLNKTAVRRRGEPRMR